MNARVRNIYCTVYYGIRCVALCCKWTCASLSSLNIHELKGTFSEMASYKGKDGGPCVSEECLWHLARNIGKEWKDTGRCLGFSDAELDHFKVDNHESIQEVIYQMLLCWKRKKGSGATSTILARALEESNRTDLTEDCISRCNDKGEILIHYLKKTYKKWLRTVRPNPTKKDRKWKLEDLFMDLGIALLDQTYNSNEEDSWKSLKTCTALFEHPELNEEASKIVIEGEPGSGKTTLMYYLAYLWCNNDKIMEGVKYFILLPLRRVTAGSSIGKIIIDVLLRASGGLLTETDVQCVLRNESCMVLALDGLDEYSGLGKEECLETSVMAIIREESEYVSPDVKVILTTRPSGLPYIHDCDVKRLKLEKLQDIHRESYVKKVFMGEEDDEKCRLILETIDANCFIRDYCELPLWFTLIVQIMRDDLRGNKGIKLESLSEFFKYILRGLRGHLVNKDREDLGDIESPKLEEIAFKGLLYSSLKQIWNKDDLASVDSYDKLVEIGILVEEEDLDSDVIYSEASMAPKTVTFLHKTFQEWYGAKHLAKLLETPDKCTQEIEQAFQIYDFHLLCFTCGISQQAAMRILDYYLADERRCRCDILFRCISEYNGDDCELKKPLSKLLLMEEVLEGQNMFALSGGDDTLLLKSKLTVLRLAYAFKIDVNSVDLRCGDLTFSPPDQMVTKRNIHIPPLSAKIITVHKCYGQPFFNFLRKCNSLQELRLNTDIFPGAPQEIRNLLQGNELKVVWHTNKHQTSHSYEMIDNEWQTITGKKCFHCDRPITGLLWECRHCSKFYLCDACKDQGCHANQSQLDRTCEQSTNPRYCGHCNKSREGTFWKCRTCSMFYLCEFCKDKGCHANNSHQLNREFAERELSKRMPSYLPFAKMLELEQYKILCSGCKEADVTVDGFECETCVNFHLCKLCKNKYPHKHKLKQRVNYTLKGCIFCRGQISCHDFKDKRCKGYGLCEDCWYTSLEPVQMFRSKRPNMFREMYEHRYMISSFFEKMGGIPDKEFKLINCVNCKVPGEIKYVWFRCKTCPEVLLCGHCKDEGIHGEHKFNRQFYLDVKCEECGIPANLMYRCKPCRGRFLCRGCRWKWKHWGHKMEEMKETELRVPASYLWIISTLLPGIPRVHEEFKMRYCENCKVAGEINKLWFRCDTCSYFLLCGRCKDEGIHGEHKFSLQRFRDINCEVCGIPVVLLYKCRECPKPYICIICQARCAHMGHEIEEIKDTEIHHKGFKCENCHHQIFGTRYKCMACSGNYNICKYCKDAGAHSMPHSFKEEQSEDVEGWMWICSHCRKGITGPLFRCKLCSEFRLCKECNSKGIHKNHEFREIHEEEIHHIGVNCKECFHEIHGSRFRCTICSGYNICQDCQVKGRHSEHTLMEIKQAELYHNMQCDRCHAGIHDIRYKCKKCRKYNICKYCIKEDICKGHKLIEMAVSDCSRCGGRTFFRSFVCEICRNYFLCEDCKLIVTNEKNCEHEFDELQMKDVQHKYIHCSLCKEYQFRGTRYRCKICKWYNLCECCKQSGHHKHHEFEEWKTSQFQPGPSELPYIY